METDALKLNEVVVTALGITQEKKALSYATQTVGGDEMNQSGTGNALEELSGKVSGLNVISNSGDPGAGVYMNLRGRKNCLPAITSRFLWWMVCRLIIQLMVMILQMAAIRGFRSQC